MYGVIVTLIYGWSLYQFFYILPSRMKFLTPLEIGSILAYTLVNDLLESLLILVGLIVIAFILPRKWLMDDFVIRGGLSVLYVLILFVFIASNKVSIQQINKYWIWASVGFVILHFVVSKISLFRKAIETLAYSSTIFLYLTVPLSLLALIVVFIRNI